MAEELLINVNVQGEEQIPNLDKTLDSVNKTAGKTKDAFSQMRTEMRNAKADMLSAAEGSDKYNDAMKRAAASVDKMRDMNDKIKASQRDVGVVAKNVTGMVSGLAGAFSTAQGIIGLFGVESDNVTKAILKVTQVMQVTSGIAQFADSFDSMKDIFLAVKLRIAEMVAAKTIDTTVTNTNTAAQVANATAIKGVGVAATTSAKAVMKALGPYALIAAAIGAIVYGVSKLIDKINEVPEEVKLNIEIDKSITNKLKDANTKAMQFAYDYNQAIKGGNKEIINGLAKRGLEEFGLHKEQLGMIAKSKDAWIDAFKSYLDYAKITYRNEFLIKANAEAQVNKDIAEERRVEYGKEIRSLKSQLREAGATAAEISNAATGSGWLMPLDPMNVNKNIDALQRLSKISKQYNDKLKEQETAEKELITTNNALRDNYVEITPPAGMKVSGTGGATESKIKLNKPNITADLTEASPWVTSGKVELNALNKIYMEAEREKIDHDKRMSDIDKASYLGIIGQILLEDQMLSDAQNKAQTDLKQAKADYDGVLKLYKDNVALNNKNILETNVSYLVELGNLNSFERKKAELLNKLAEEQAKFDADKTDKGRISTQITIDNINTELAANQKGIDTLKNTLKDLDDKKKKLEAIRDDLTKSPEEVQKAADKIKQINIEIEALKVESDRKDIERTNKNVRGNIGQIIADYKRIKEAKKALKGLNEDKKVQQDIIDDPKTDADGRQAAADRIVEINKQIEDSNAELFDATKAFFQGMSAEAQHYLGLLTNVTDGLAQYYQAQQQQIDSQTEGYKDIANGSKISKKEEEKLRKNDLKTYNAAQKAKNGTDEDRAKFVQALEMSAWEEKSKLFEKEKLAQKASAWMNFASGTVKIWANAYELGPIAGPIIAAVETAGLLATTLAQVKTINAQRLDSPSDGSSSSSNAPTASAFAALNPSQTTMTTSQENLNMMNASNKVQAVVKVSEINEVQNIVRVRENNSSY